MTAATSSRLRLAFDRAAPRSRRLFAALELFCAPASALALAAAALLALARAAAPDWTPPRAASAALAVLLSAAVGYLTNRIAITMLFEPYERTWRHWLPWCTLGLWRQGLLPRNKRRIAGVLGREVAGRLLRPEKLADDLCDMAGAALASPAALDAAATLLSETVAAHDRALADFLAPRLEEAVAPEIDRLCTPARIRAFWDERLAPRLASEEARAAVARFACDALHDRAPHLAARLKPWISGTVRRYVRERFEGTLLSEVPLVGKTVNDALAAAIASSADALADFFLDEKTIAAALSDALRRPETADALRDELAGVVAAVRARLASPAGFAPLAGAAESLRTGAKDLLREALRERLAPAAARWLRGPGPRACAAAFLPALRPGLERALRTVGADAVVRRLDVEGRVQSAVDAMDMREFHALLDAIMAEHLGAIQVLGWLLGALAGLLLPALAR